MANTSCFDILGSKGKFNFKIAPNCRNAQPMAVLHSLRWSLLCHRRQFSSLGCSGQGGQTLILLFRQLLYIILRYETSTLIIYEELSSSLFFLKFVSESVSETSVSPGQMCTFFKCLLLTKSHQFPSITASY